MKVVIVGAGIGGLVLALRLHHAGVACEVHEQSERAGDAGVGINLLPHAVRELADLGLLGRLDEIGVRTAELIYSHRLGPEIMRRPCGRAAGYAVPQFCLHRGRLRDVLLAAVRDRLGPGAVRTGHRLVRVDQDADAVRAHLVDRYGAALPAVHGDVLVGADGIHSTVRAGLFPAEGPPRWNGVVLWRGAADWPAFGTGASMLIAGGTAAKLVVFPMGSGREPGTRFTNWAICVRTGEPGDPPPNRQDWSRPADPADLDRHVALFRTPLVDHAALVAATGRAYEFPMCDRDPLPHWGRGRVTLLGDAAHPMFPMGSNGAAQAVLDARSLVDELTRHDDPAAALRAYERGRLPATAELVRRNRLGGPEGVIDEVERRAQGGFTALADVIDPAELAAIVAGYAQVSGAAGGR